MHFIAVLHDIIFIKKEVRSIQYHKSLTFGIPHFSNCMYLDPGSQTAGRRSRQQPAAEVAWWHPVPAFCAVVLASFESGKFTVPCSYQCRCQ